MQNEEKTILLKDLSEKWILLQNRQLKESTQIKYRNLLNNYILPNMGELLLSDINYIKLSQFRNELLEYGGCKNQGLSTKTVADIFSLLHEILNYGEKTGIAEIGYLGNIPIRQKKKEIRILTRCEQGKIEKYVKEKSTEAGIAVLLSMYTGMRVGEICALRNEDIDFSENVIYVRRTMQRIQTDSGEGPKTKILITESKSPHSIRAIPMPEYLAGLIKQYQKSLHGYYLTGSEEKYIEPRVVQYFFQKLILKLGIKKATFHCLRHTFATRCVEVGFDVKTLSEILGHASVSITMNLYVHPSLELKRENMEKLSNLFLTEDYACST